jgi:hypothetical protein
LGFLWVSEKRFTGHGAFVQVAEKCLPGTDAAASTLKGALPEGGG